MNLAALTSHAHRTDARCTACRSPRRPHAVLLASQPLDLPPPSPSLHIHSSPPCTDLSPARGGNVPAADVEAGLQMIRWALDLVMERGDFSWSGELAQPTMYGEENYEREKR